MAEKGENKVNYARFISLLMLLIFFDIIMFFIFGYKYSFFVASIFIIAGFILGLIFIVFMYYAGKND